VDAAQNETKRIEERITTVHLSFLIMSFLKALIAGDGGKLSKDLTFSLKGLPFVWLKNHSLKRKKVRL